MEAMEMKEIEAAVEGILFASGEPVAADRIAVALDLDRDTVDQVLRRLADYYSYERRGMRLVRMEDTWQLCSAPEYADLTRRAFELPQPAQLSPPVASMTRTISAISSGGCCRSASIITAKSPREARSPAYMAASLPKLRLKEMYRTRSSCRCSFRAVCRVPSFEPSSTKMISKSAL